MKKEDSEKYRKYREYQNAWARKNRQKTTERQRKWRTENKQKVNEQMRRYRKKKRLETLQYYSKSEIPFCACCGEKEVGFLTIDHINNDGAEHRRQIKNGAKGHIDLKVWLNMNGFPKGFQVLCYNCNCAKAFVGVCPHAKIKDDADIRQNNESETDRWT